MKQLQIHPSYGSTGDLLGHWDSMPPAGAEGLRLLGIKP